MIKEMGTPLLLSPCGSVRWLAGWNEVTGWMDGIHVCLYVSAGE